MNGEQITVNGSSCVALRLLGKGKGGYSYLAERNGALYVLKQLHHEPCDYYQFGDKLQSELNDYKRLVEAGIPVPELVDVDRDGERILKVYIKGPTVMELLRAGEDVSAYLPQARGMSARARERGLNIDWFPTNFVVRDGKLWYIDYECNEYMDEWSFERWGVKYWSRTPALEAYWREHAL